MRASSVVQPKPEVSHKKRDYEAMLPLQCMMGTLFIVKITLHQNANQSHGCTSVYDSYLWVRCKMIQASFVFYHGLQHFRWGYACHVEATSLHRVPGLICFIPVFQRHELLFAAPWKMNTCAWTVSRWQFYSVILLMLCFSVGYFWNVNILHCCT